MAMKKDAGTVPQLRHAAYIPGIDGLRAVAVLSVMLYHLDSRILPGGFVGVDVFFAISGFVVTLSIYQSKFDHIFSLFSYFYARRLLRIAPALIVMLLVVSLATVAFVPNAFLSEENQLTATHAFFGFSNVFLAGEREQYFAPRSDFNPFLHTWSLGVEEQFYLLFPFVIGAATISRLSSRNASLAICGGISGLSFLLCAYLSSRYPLHSFYQIPSRFWELGIGVVLALSIDWWAPRVRQLRTAFAGALSACALAGIAISFVLANEGDFPFPWALPPAAGAAFIFCMFASGRPMPVLAPLLWSGPTLIGKWSYSLYLWHWPTYCLMRWTTGLDTVSLQAAAVAITFAVSIGSYYFVEQPFRRPPLLRRVPRFAVVAGFLLAIIAGAATSRLVFNHADRLSLSDTKRTDIWYPYHLFEAPGSGCRAVDTERWEGPLHVVSISPSGCTAEGLRRMFVAGDLHALAYKAMLSRTAAEDGFEVLIYEAGGCVFMNLAERIGAATRRCQEFNHRTIAALRSSAGPGDYVFLPSLRIPRFRDQWGGPENNKNGATDPEAVREADEFVQMLRSKGAIVILEAPKPVFRSPPFRCSDWFNRNNSICADGFSVSRGVFDARRASAMAAQNEIAADDAGVVIWDPAAILCDLRTCNAFDGRLPLFFDGDHLSGHGNDVLHQNFRATVESKRR